MSRIVESRYLIARRAAQLGVLVLLWLGAHYHLGVLTGDLSASRLLRTVPLADPWAILQILATGHVVAGTALLGGALVLLLWLLAGGRGFCAWVCPVNPVADLAAWLRRSLELRGQLRIARSSRYWVAALALAVSAATGVAAFEAVSPIGMTHRALIFGPGSGLAAVAGILLLDLAVLRPGWCGSLCPLGAMASRGFIDAGNGLNCARCLEVCPRDAFHFPTRFRAAPSGSGG
jgi:ferredoxin-type protein NapH